MPAVSTKQRRFMGADLARKRAGKKTRTGMSEDQFEDYAGSEMGGTRRRCAMPGCGKMHPRGHPGR